MLYFIVITESRITAHNIQTYAKNKSDQFHNSPVLEDMPITDTNQTISQIALILYQFVVNELVIMKTKTSKLRKSIWYSAGKNDSIIKIF